MIFLLIIPFLAMLIALFLLSSIRSFRNIFLNEVHTGLARTSGKPAKILTEKDIIPLPSPVQKYLRYTGVIGKEKVMNFRVYFHGQLQDIGKPPFRVHITQFSYLDIPTRLFYITGKMKRLPVTALHIYKDTHASFQVKLFSAFSIVDQKEGYLNVAETVTMLNDMCLLAPATLIDKRISWETIDDLHAKVIYTNKEIKVSAVLEFNELGELIRFTSEDRYYINSKGEMIRTRWTTPVGSYVDFKGVKIASVGTAYWSFPDKDFTYAWFRIKDVEYNVKKQ